MFQAASAAPAKLSTSLIHIPALYTVVNTPIVPTLDIFTVHPVPVPPVVTFPVPVV